MLGKARTCSCNGRSLWLSLIARNLLYTSFLCRCVVKGSPLPYNWLHVGCPRLLGVSVNDVPITLFVRWYLYCFCCTCTYFLEISSFETNSLLAISMAQSSFPTHIIPCHSAKFINCCYCFMIVVDGKCEFMLVPTFFVLDRIQVSWFNWICVLVGYD